MMLFFSGSHLMHITHITHKHQPLGVGTLLTNRGLSLLLKNPRAWDPGAVWPWRGRIYLHVLCSMSLCLYPRTIVSLPFVWATREHETVVTAAAIYSASCVFYAPDLHSNTLLLCSGGPTPHYAMRKSCLLRGRHP